MTPEEVFARIGLVICAIWLVAGVALYASGRR